MRGLSRLALILSLLSVTPVLAQRKSPKTAPPPAPVIQETSALRAELDQLKQIMQDQARELRETREALRSQQEKMDAIEKQFQAQHSAVQNAQSAAEKNATELNAVAGQVEGVAQTASELQKKIAVVQTEVATAGRAAEGRFRQLGNFHFSGDIRFRYEPFFQAQQTTRQRQRIRARLNLTGNLTDELYGGITLASGGLDDPISTNQTLTNFFNRKTVGFDRFFIQWTPKALNNHAAFGLGKFAFPWIRTGLTFDPDLNPEGVYARLNWDFKTEVFKGVSLVGFHLPFFERGGSTNPTTGVRADGLDGFVAGGQVQTRWKFGDRVTLGLNIAGINFVNADLIAQAHAPNPATASLANALVGNQPTTNSLRTNAAGQVVGYASRFLYLDTLATLGISTSYPRWPLNINLNFVNNTRAQLIIQNNTAAPTGAAHNRERSAYLADFQFGRLSEKKDIQFGYIYTRIERDAVIGAFSESDMRAGTNINQHRLNFSYQWLNNMSLNYAIWIGRMQNAQDAIGLVPGGKRAIAGGPCNVAPFDGCRDNILKRMQFDVIYRF
ncbi:MAG TPA: putative porin [Candidatus Acidoferrales bacterium]|nr:putative porin [Candidatus Acidoferrales bacterium]